MKYAVAPSRYVNFTENFCKIRITYAHSNKLYRLSGYSLRIKTARFVALHGQDGCNTSYYLYNTIYVLICQVFFYVNLAFNITKMICPPIYGGI